MEVFLSDKNESPSKVIDTLYIAARTCYCGKDYHELLKETEEKSLEDKTRLVKKVMDSGHCSVAEHISFTYNITGISRSCSHQLVRNRIASYSQASQRYICYEGKPFKYVVPPEIESNKELLKLYEGFMKNAKEVYDKLIEADIKAEDARFVLPNAAETNITMTMNIRELMHVMGLRLCHRAQWEIRQLFEKIQALTVAAYPFLQDYLQPNCIQMGFCPESNGSCGFYPRKSEIMRVYKDYQNH